MIVGKIQNFLCVAAKKVFLCVHIFIVVMVLLEFGRLAGDVFPLHYQLLNALLALIGLTAIFLLFFICCTRKLASCVCKKNRVVMFCIFYAVIIFVMQMYLCKCIYFYTTWDVGILQSAADVVTHGGTIQDWISQRGDSFSQNYFNAYPNNIFLTIIFAGIKYLSSLFGCVDNYFPTIVTGVISTDAAIVFTVMTVWKLTQSRKVTFLSIIICTVFLGFNPWIIIPYSDTYVLPFLSAILYFYCSMKDEKKGYASWIGIVIAASLGIKIKPTVVIALFAIVLAEIIFLRKCQIKEVAAKCLIAAGGTIIVLGLINSLSDAVYDQRNADAQMTWQHYLMMGANEETYGSYFGVDRERSWGTSDPEKRKEMQIEVWKQRISEKGIWGTIKFYMQKLIIANDDGSFAWGWEGNFFGEYRGLHSEFAQKLQSFYYAQDNKMIYNILQSIWVSIQILVCFFAIFFDNRNKRALFIAMTLTGINLFLMIFEVRARYLFMFVPFYITAAMLGLFYTQEKVKIIKDRKCYLQ